MDYVSKEVAVKLEEAGFPQPEFHLHGGAKFHPDGYATPDFLTAADWLWDKHGIGITFMPIMTSFETSAKDYTEFSAMDSFDHRNEALLFALNQIKK